MVLDLTLLPGFARITGQARVDTRSVDARPFRRALVAVSTSNFCKTVQSHVSAVLAMSSLSLTSASFDVAVIELTICNLNRGGELVMK